MYTGLHVKYPLFLTDFNETRISSTVFRTIFKYKTSLKSAHWEPICSGRTDMTKQIIVFRSFASAPNNLVLSKPK